MKKILSLVLFILLCACAAHAQRFKTTTGNVTFFSDAPMEDIEANSAKVTSILDLEKGDMAFLIPINSFQFEKKLMQEHFNENYLESEKYPDATFRGKLINYDPNAQGKQTVQAKGEMTIHGVTKKIDAEGTLEPSGDGLTLTSKFPIRVADYKIKIPKIVFYNIAEVVDVTLSLTYQQQ
ncbi:MAG: YceI family protein [Bacteroidota bacterium]